jgi:hypothetical protein
LLETLRLVKDRQKVRLKITRKISGSIDGIQLQQFIPGQIYDVSTSFGSYLLAERAAEPVNDDPPSPFTPARERADDRPPRSRERKRS